jgi:hypothetical protein
VIKAKGFPALFMQTDPSGKSPMDRGGWQGWCWNPDTIDPSSPIYWEKTGGWPCADPYGSPLDFVGTLFDTIGSIAQECTEAALAAACVAAGKTLGASAWQLACMQAVLPGRQPDGR